MQYIFCPRCKFRVALNKHMCGTCGYVIPSPQSSRAVNDADAHLQTRRQGFWQTFLGIDPKPEESKEQGREGTALGEV